MVAVLVVAACSLALYLYHVQWLAPEKLRAALRSQGIAGPRPSFPYGNLAEMKQLSAAAAARHRRQRRRGIVHDYRPAVFPFYEKWRNHYGTFNNTRIRIRDSIYTCALGLILKSFQKTVNPNKQMRLYISFTISFSLLYSFIIPATVE